MAEATDNLDSDVPEISESAFREFHRGLLSDESVITYDRNRDVLYVGVGPSRPCISYEIGDHLVMRFGLDHRISAFEIYDFSIGVVDLVKDAPEAAALFRAYIRWHKPWYRVWYWISRSLDLSNVVEAAFEAFETAIRGDYRQDELRPV